MSGMDMSKAAAAFFKKNPNHPMLHRNGGGMSSPLSGGSGTPRWSTQDAMAAMHRFDIHGRLWDRLTQTAKDVLIRNGTPRDSLKVKRKIGWAMKIDSKISGRDALLVSGHRIVKRGDPEWGEASRLVSGYAFDDESPEETIAKSKRLVSEGRERVNARLKAARLHELMTGRLAPLYRGYLGRKRKTLFLHDSGEHPLHSLYIGNKKKSS